MSKRYCSPPGGLAEGLSRGALVIDMSSISPIATREFAGRIAALGAAYLDAPVSGGETGAKAATLTIMVGGPQKAFERALPLFQLMGKPRTRPVTLAWIGSRLTGIAKRSQGHRASA